MDTSWLVAYGAEAALTDRFKGEDRRPHLLAAGLLGEAGSLAAEFKKITREEAAYPAYRQRVREELGDFLWYFVRLVEEYNTELLAKLPLNQESTPHERMELPTRLGSAVGRVLGFASQPIRPHRRRTRSPVGRSFGHCGQRWRRS